MDQELNTRIIDRLPYCHPFLFVDKILDVDDKGIIGNYTYREDEGFYKGHFKHKPVTPGVILLETMGQIGCVAFLIYLQKLWETNQHFHPMIAHIEADFQKEVLPNETMTVTGTLVYYRMGILKTSLEMKDPEGEVVARAIGNCKFIFEDK